MAATFWMMLTLTLSAILIPLVYGAGSNNHEIQALDAFRKSLVDPNNELRNWDTSLDNPCTWRYIGCHPDTNRVVELGLFSINLSGQLVPELAQLSALLRLIVSRTSITGTIPSALGNLTELRELNLSENQISGNIPPSLGNLKSLQDLRLQNNRLTGKVPSQIANMPRLEYANLANNTDLCWDFFPTPRFVGNYTLCQKK